MSGPAVTDPTLRYRREARRIRGAFATGSAQLYHSLRRLSDLADASLPRFGNQTRAADRVSAFARLAAAQLDGRVLSYSRRLSLLKTAGLLGIGRFHANLIIAAVQHEAPGPAFLSEPRLNKSFSKSLSALTFLLVQAAILLGLWAVFIG